MHPLSMRALAGALATALALPALAADPTLSKIQSSGTLTIGYREWRGEPQSLEGQAFAWQGTVGVEPLLPATIPLLEWLDEVRRESLAPA